MRILLVHHDSPTLLGLSQVLREREIVVSIAHDAAMATERAGLGEYDVVLVSRVLAEATDQGLGVIDALALELPSPPPVIVLATPGTEASPSEVHEGDIDGMLTKLTELAPIARASSGALARERTSLMPSSFTMKRTPIASLLHAFADEKRSGTLTVTTAKGKAVACVFEGQLVDVLFGKHQGEKALARLVAAKDGNTQFSPGDPGVLPRLDTPTQALVARASERAEAFAMLTSRFDVPIESVYYMQSAPFLEGDDRGLASRILDRLRGPMSLGQLVDELGPPDVEILGAVVALEATGHVRRVDENVGERAPLASHDEVQQLRASASKARGHGYAGLGRIVIAAAPSRLMGLSQALLGIVEAVAPDDPSPTLPLPHTMAELRLGEGVSVDVVALPLVPAYAPLWPLAVAGAHAVVTLDDSHEALEEACASTARHLHGARALVASFDPTRPQDVAALLRAALEIGG